MLKLFRKPDAQVPAPVAPRSAAEHQLGEVVFALSQQASVLGQEAAEVRGAMADTAKASLDAIGAMRELAERLKDGPRSQDAIDVETQGSLGTVAATRQAVESVGD